MKVITPQMLKLLILMISFSLMSSLGMASTATTTGEVGDGGTPASMINCNDIKAERNEACEKAYEICLEVHEKYAYNQIRSCAHYSEKCHYSIETEDRYCDEPQISLHSQGKSSSSTQ